MLITISQEIDSIKHEELQLSNILIAKLPPKTIKKFKDPFKYVPERHEGDEPSNEEPTQDEEDEFKYLLGHAHLVDTEGGDAGCLLKKAKYYPYVEFIRSQFCGKHQNSILHSDVAAVGGNSKQMKEYFITTGLVVAYQGTFDV
jgi:hypothetical protein